jgi:transglutaminase-like putative cysteine protease
MRLTIHHQTTFVFASPARRVIETLRLTPRGHNGQFVVSWRIDVDKDCRLQRTIDPFGNTLHSFTVEGPIDGLIVTASGSIETQDMNGVLSGQLERLPPPVFLRETPLTAADAAIRSFAEAVQANSDGPLAVMHSLMAGISDRLTYDPEADGWGAGAQEAFTAGHGICQDFAHVFIAAARHINFPTRYVSGYLYRPDGPHTAPACHAWAEALIPGLGWVGFDAANDMSPTDTYVRVAVGLDSLGAAAIRGAQYGADETVSVAVTVNDGTGERRLRPTQTQRQSQS